jgi:membrane protein DedA with SNARE-associated domain
MTTSLDFLKYAGIFASAAIEGEVVYVGAVVLAFLGKLNPIGVLIAGACGGSFGDQAYFYILRTARLAHWLDKFPSLVQRRDRISDKVHRHARKLILGSRFLPGLRIAIPAACAYTGIEPLQFSTLSLISGFAWASAIMILVMYLGPTSLRQLGIQAWWAPAIPAILVIVFFRWLSRVRG